MKRQFIVLVFSLLFSSCATKLNSVLNKQFIHVGSGYSKAVTVIANNVKTIYIAGLTGDGDDLETQTKSVFVNIKMELEAAGATLKDVVKMNTYIVNYQPGNIEIFRRVRKEILGETNMPASTVVGVQALAVANKIIEIEAVAVIQINKKN
ncbi:MAG: RidA family protein [Deinococcales bacterium]|nr:RidA family protein [Chitinophagaceae bacterium]